MNYLAITILNPTIDVLNHGIGLLNILTCMYASIPGFFRIKVEKKKLVFPISPIYLTPRPSHQLHKSFVY